MADRKSTVPKSRSTNHPESVDPAKNPTLAQVREEARPLGSKRDRTSHDRTSHDHRDRSRSPRPPSPKAARSTTTEDAATAAAKPATTTSVVNELTASLDQVTRERDQALKQHAATAKEAEYWRAAYEALKKHAVHTYKEPTTPFEVLCLGKGPSRSARDALAGRRPDPSYHALYDLAYAILNATAPPPLYPTAPSDDEPEPEV